MYVYIDFCCFRGEFRRFWLFLVGIDGLEKFIVNVFRTGNFLRVKESGNFFCLFRDFGSFWSLEKSFF